jgi:hypothetical protein
MTISILHAFAPNDDVANSAESDSLRYRRTIQLLVDGYAKQDVDGIMSLFADDAVYCDILGSGVRGDEYHGKDAIRCAVVRQFDLGGRHTYVNPRIMVEGRSAFASWTLVAGDPADAEAARFEGIDEFLLNEDAHVTLKKAWLKGQPRLRRHMLMRNPSAAFRHLGYALRSWGR